MKKQLHILCLFDYQCTTGFATVSHNIIRELKNHYQERLKLDILAINYFGPPVQPDKLTTILPAAKLEEGTKYQDVFGRTVFLQLLRTNNYDGAFIIQDPGVVLQMGIMINEIKERKKRNREKPFKTIWYFPEDGVSVKDNFDGFDYFDQLVTYTEFGKWEIAKKRPDLLTKIKVIPHGVNSNNFYAISSDKKQRFRNDYFGKNAQRTIITNVNRNQPRKDIPTTIFAFDEYKKNYNKDSFLYLHMTPEDPMGWNLERIFKQLDMIKGIDYMFPPKDAYHAGASVETLNSIYNASDLYLTTTSGEGWGLGITEAMQCKIPVVAPMHTSIIEIGGNGSRLWPLNKLRPYCTHYDSRVRWQCDIEETASIINEVIKNPGLASSKVELAYEYAITITWEKVCRRWIDLFVQTFE